MSTTESRKKMIKEAFETNLVESLFKTLTSDPIAATAHIKSIVESTDAKYEGMSVKKRIQIGLATFVPEQIEITEEKYKMSYIKPANDGKHVFIKHNTHVEIEPGATTPERVKHLVHASEKHKQMKADGYKIHQYGEHDTRPDHYMQKTKVITEEIEELDELTKAEMSAMAAAAMKTSGDKVQKIQAGVVSNISGNAWKKAAQNGGVVKVKGTTQKTADELAPSATFKGTRAGKKFVKEEEILDEAKRGRPSKNAANDEGGDDASNYANPMVQLKFGHNKKKNTLKFSDGAVHAVSPNHVQAAMDKLSELKPAAREDKAKEMFKSKAHFDKHIGAQPVKEDTEIAESFKSDSYHASSIPSQFGGHRPHVVHKEKGHTMYLGSTSYKKPEHAAEHAKAYLSGYASGGESEANRRGHSYEKQSQSDLYKKK